MSQDDGAKPEKVEATPAPRRSSWLTGAAIVVAVVAIYVLARGQKRPAPAPSPEHGDHADPFGGMNAVHKAILNAPVGATDCETAWNAYDAMETALKAAGQPSAVQKHPDRQTFLDVCAGFTVIEQQCLNPRFKNVNADRCDAEAMGVWSEADSLRRKNLFTIFGPREAPTAPSGTKSPSPLAADAGGD